MAFDPNAHEERNLPSPGDKVVAWVRIAPETATQNGAPYFPTTLVVLHDRVAASGEKGDKGALLFDDVFSNDKSAWRLAQICRAVKNMTPFDEHDLAAMRSRLMLNSAGEGVAVVATIAHETYAKKDGSGTGTKAKIVKFSVFGGEWGDDFDDLIEKGEANAKKAAEKRGQGGSSGGGGSSSGGGSTKRYSGSGVDENTGLPNNQGGDDDIPF